MRKERIAELHFVEVEPDKFEAVLIGELGTREPSGRYVNLNQANFSPYVLKVTGEMVDPPIPIRVFYLPDENKTNPMNEKTKQTPCSGELSL